MHLIGKLPMPLMGSISKVAFRAYDATTLHSRCLTLQKLAEAVCEAKDPAENC